MNKKNIFKLTGLYCCIDIKAKVFFHNGDQSFGLEQMRFDLWHFGHFDMDRL